MKNHLLKIEGFARATHCTLFEYLINQTTVGDNSTRLVVEAQDIENRSVSAGQPNDLPDANLHEPRYRVYS